MAALGLGTGILISSLTTKYRDLTYAVGFGVALILFAGVRERVIIGRVPKPLQDTSIALVVAGMIALAFYAFKGMA